MTLDVAANASLNCHSFGVLPVASIDDNTISPLPPSQHPCPNHTYETKWTKTISGIGLVTGALALGSLLVAGAIKQAQKKR